MQFAEDVVTSEQIYKFRIYTQEEYPVLDTKATGARIRELRKARHLKVEDVARFMGFESEQAVYKWQRGDSLPTVDNLYALSRLFGTSVDNILRGNKERDEDLSLFVFEKLNQRYRETGTAFW